MLSLDKLLFISTNLHILRQTYLHYDSNAIFLLVQRSDPMRSQKQEKAQMQSQNDKKGYIDHPFHNSIFNLFAFPPICRISGTLLLDSSRTCIEDFDLNQEHFAFV